MREAEQRGCTVIDGLGMLVNQGVIGIEYWTGIRPDATVMRRALEASPGGVLYLGAQPGNERFFEQAGFRRGPTGYVGRRS